MAQEAPRRQFQRPFTVLVLDDASHAGGYAFEEAARVVERIPYAALHALYIEPRHTSLAKLQEIAPSLRADTSGRAASLGILDRLMAIHLRAGDEVAEVAELVRELGADLVIVGVEKRLSLRRIFGQSIAAKLRDEVPCPVVLAAPSPTPTPEIEPPCPACLTARATSEGRTWWCRFHAQPHALAHHYAYRREHAFAQHDSNFIPTGISFG